MCSLTGIISNDAIKYNNILKMNRLMTYRGPDSSEIIGLTTDECFQKIDINLKLNLKCVMGFNRLSIRDLSEAGNQPMIGHHTALSFVGEIYNADALKNKLLLEGEVFSGSSDTEVILKWYESFGIDSLLNSIQGIYSIVLIDYLKRKAFLFRDKFGVKPLYYYFNNNVMVYASEIKSICCSDYYKERLDYSSLGESLLYRSPGNSTLFKEVKHVVPGEIISFDIGTGNIELNKWFDINNYSRMCKNEISQEEAFGLLEDGLIKSVGRQMVSDVPLGIQLSGGIDSAIIAYIARTYKDVYSYSMLGGQGYYSEEEQIRRINQSNYGRMKLYDFKEKDLNAAYETVIWHLDGLNNHPNALGFYQLTKNASKEVKVLLSGEGADELMGGYRQFADGKSIKEHYDSYAVYADCDADIDLIKMMFPTVDLDSCVQHRMDVFNSFYGDNLDKHIKYELATYLPDLLIKQDRMAMANSVENRVPFLDDELVKIVMSIPNDYLVKYAQETGKYEGKYILKKLAANYYDKSLGFQKKRGFPMPIADWMKQSKFRKYVSDYIIPGMKTRGVIDERVFLKYFECLSTLNEKEIKVLWKAINLETWAQLFLDGRAPMEIL